MIQAHNGTAPPLYHLHRARGRCLHALSTDNRNWDGGIRKFLFDELCGPDIIERIMAYVKNA
jgi:hypothetical protein